MWWTGHVPSNFLLDVLALSVCDCIHSVCVCVVFIVCLCCIYGVFIACTCVALFLSPTVPHLLFPHHIYCPAAFSVITRLPTEEYSHLWNTFKELTILFCSFSTFSSDWQRWWWLTSCDGFVVIGFRTLSRHNHHLWHVVGTFFINQYDMIVDVSTVKSSSSELQNTFCILLQSFSLEQCVRRCSILISDGKQVINRVSFGFLVFFLEISLIYLPWQMKVSKGEMC